MFQEQCLAFLLWVLCEVLTDTWNACSQQRISSQHDFFSCTNIFFLWTIHAYWSLWWMAPGSSLLFSLSRLFLHYWTFCNLLSSQTSFFRFSFFCILPQWSELTSKSWNLQLRLKNAQCLQVTSEWCAIFPTTLCTSPLQILAVVHKLKSTCLRVLPVLPL